MKNMLKVMNDVTDFILGKEEESLLDKKKKTIGFVADGVKPKRKYTRRKRKFQRKNSQKGYLGTYISPNIRHRSSVLSK